MKVNLIKSDVINTIYKKTGTKSYTIWLPNNSLIPYIERILAKNSNGDFIELNQKTFANGNKLRTYTQKTANNPIQRIKMLLDKANNVIKFQNTETPDATAKIMKEVDFSKITIEDIA